jgi:predicted ATP-dependent serine protease
VSAGVRGEFVGREHELRELRHGLDKALAGEGRLFLISGEPGIGKSRLVEQLARRAPVSAGSTSSSAAAGRPAARRRTGRGSRRFARTREIAIPSSSAASSAAARRTSCRSFPS